MLSIRAMFSTDAMRALWTDAALYAAMLRFEAALAQAQARCGLIPPAAAESIAQACARPEVFDWTAISADARKAGTAAIPFAKALKQEVARRAPEHAAFVHYGSTSQDVCETALMLQAQAALRLIHGQMRDLGDALAHLVQTHRRTAMLARTLMQPAAPISFGWKAAGWLDALDRCAGALQDAGEACRVIQFGGANGTRAALGVHGQALADAVAGALGLRGTPIAWQSARDRLARLGNELALCCAMLGKLGRDISLLMQSEVAEAFEPSGAGRGGSSAMPHKRNPMACMHMLDAALRAPPLALSLVSDMTAEHERGLGSWPNALPLLADLFMLLDNALSMAVETAQGLRVDPEAMQANLVRQHGVVHSETVGMLLARALGPAAAQRIVDALCRQALEQGAELRDLLLHHPEVDGRIPAADIEQACGVERCLDAAEAPCVPVLAAWAARRAGLHVAAGMADDSPS
ncbi:class-II fumarase/aspartase family protein [Bordetella sp. H567]|uniref:class-II fumarase/aspartase family protein n=1 Tax=Bordetella sp. H567 TaxID=1697043 RepID=UPI000829B002|nr:adenylosuccinate lyase family protein [Bordetella sp. H567]